MEQQQNGNNVTTTNIFIMNDILNKYHITVGPKRVSEILTPDEKHSLLSILDKLKINGVNLEVGYSEISQQGVVTFKEVYDSTGLDRIATVAQ